MRQLAYDRMNDRDQKAGSTGRFQLFVINTKNRCGSSQVGELLECNGARSLKIIRVKAACLDFSPAPSWDQERQVQPAVSPD